MYVCMYVLYLRHAGMVVGETRRVTLPFSLAYDMKGDKAMAIPPFATMIYTVRLLSLT